MPEIKRVAICTGGGDAPGLNAVIRAATLAGLKRGWEMAGIYEGYSGLLEPERFPDNGLMRLDRHAVRGITHLGGTILGTTNRGSPLSYPVENPDGTITEVDRSDQLVQAFRQRGLDALVAIGGDGSMAIAHTLSQKGMRIVGVPKTIDNDLDKTSTTFGFDSAVAFATECIDRLHSTAEAHDRVMVVEVMGRYAGWIALYAGVAASADAILIPEIPYEIEEVAEKIRRRVAAGADFAIVVVAEGARPKGDDDYTMVERPDGVKRLGGAGKVVADQLAKQTGKETRSVILGHLLRGGTPSARDRLLALRFGAAAIRALDEGESGIMVALDPPNVNYVPLEEATRRMKTVPLDSDVIRTGRDLGISFGD